MIARGLDPFPALRLAQLSDVYRNLGRGRDALAVADQAVAACGDEVEACANAYGVRLEAQTALGRPEAALADLSSALERVEALRSQAVPSDFLKQDFLRSYRSFFDGAIALQLSEGHERQALETAEWARSRAFLDLLASRSLSPAPGPSSSRLFLTRNGGIGETGVTTEVKGQAAPATAADLTATASRLGSTMLVYWVGSGETSIWIVKPDGAIHARRVRVQQTRLASLVRDGPPFAGNAAATGPQKRVGARRQELRDVAPALRELYGLLIAPIRDLLPTSPGALLTIVPHDTLSGLSFAALRDRAGRYLLEDYALHYAPAGAMLQFTALMPQQPPRTGSMLLVSDPAPPHQSALDAPLPRLPGARREAAAIERVMGTGHVTALQDAAATETRVRELTPGRSVLHFATHAVVRDDDPFASFLALGPSEGDGAADGLLTAQDIYGLHLSASLVVLSACRSAGGDIAGDGIAAFARAFFCTRARPRSWRARGTSPTNPFNRLLPDFYRAWLGGASKAASLRRAQLRLLADLRAGHVRVKVPIGEVQVPEHPVFWAGFMLFGEP